MAKLSAGRRWQRASVQSRKCDKAFHQSRMVRSVFRSSPESCGASQLRKSATGSCGKKLTEGLRYNVEHGDIEQILVQQARNAGEPIPEAIANKPRLAPGNRFFWDAFFDLDTERSHGQGLSKIPRSAISAYAAECGLNEDEKFELIYVIRRVDDWHLDELAKKLAVNADT